MQFGVHDHFGEEHACGRVGGGAPVDGDLDGAGRDVVQFKVAVGVGVDDFALLTEDVDLGMGDGQFEHVVGGVDDAVGATAYIVEGHRFQVGAGIDDPADNFGACHRAAADGGEACGEFAARAAVAVGIEEHAVGLGANLRAVHMQGDLRTAGHRVGEEQPGKRAVGSRHDGGGELAAIGRGGVDAVGGEGGGVDGAGEPHLRTDSHTDIAAAVGGRG